MEGTINLLRGQTMNLRKQDFVQADRQATKAMTYDLLAAIYQTIDKAAAKWRRNPAERSDTAATKGLQNEIQADSL